MDDALWVHAQIKAQLKAAILSPEGVDAELVRSDRGCEFGQWIYGAGLRYCGMPEYQALKRTHRSFHEAAFAALTLCRQGKRHEAEEMVATGAFERGSIDMKATLKTLRTALAVKVTAAV